MIYLPVLVRARGSRTWSQSYERPTLFTIIIHSYKSYVMLNNWILSVKFLPGRRTVLVRVQGSRTWSRSYGRRAPAPAGSASHTPCSAQMSSSSTADMEGLNKNCIERMLEIMSHFLTNAEKHVMSLHVPIANYTQKVQSSDRLKWHCSLFSSDVFFFFNYRHNLYNTIYTSTYIIITTSGKYTGNLFRMCIGIIYPSWNSR